MNHYLATPACPGTRTRQGGKPCRATIQLGPCWSSVPGGMLWWSRQTVLMLFGKPESSKRECDYDGHRTTRDTNHNFDFLNVALAAGIVVELDPRTLELLAGKAIPEQQGACLICIPRAHRIENRSPLGGGFLNPGCGPICRGLELLRVHPWLHCHWLRITLCLREIACNRHQGKQSDCRDDLSRYHFH